MLEYTPQWPTSGTLTLGFVVSSQHGEDFRTDTLWQHLHRVLLFATAVSLSVTRCSSLLPISEDHVNVWHSFLYKVHVHEPR